MAISAEHKVAVVIPTWRRNDLLKNCLQSLGQQTFIDFETVVVSNGAGDQAARVAKAAGCAVIRLPSNLGFAAAVNAGIARSQLPYVLVLNDDVELDPRWLERTVAFLDERPEYSYCCGKIFQADGLLLDNAGDALSLGGSAWRLGYGRPIHGSRKPGTPTPGSSRFGGAGFGVNDSGGFDLPRTVWAVSGTATLFRRSVFEKIGLFEEDFFAYLEDMDFSLRAARAGFRGFYLPEATCSHLGSATLGPDSPTMIRLLTRNQLLLLAKNYPVTLLLRLAPRIFWTQVLWLLRSVWRRRFGAYLAGLAGFFRLLPSAVRKRTAWRAEEAQAFRARLASSEREIFADVLAPDRRDRGTLFRLYFALFPPRGKPEGSLRTAP